MSKGIYIVSGIAVIGIGYFVFKHLQIPSHEVERVDFINRVITYRIFGKVYQYRVGTSGGTGIKSGKYTFEISETPSAGKALIYFTLRKNGQVVYSVPYQETV